MKLLAGSPLPHPYGLTTNQALRWSFNGFSAATSEKVVLTLLTCRRDSTPPASVEIIP